MTEPFSRYGKGMLATVVALAALGAAVAFAGSTPKPGVHYQVKNAGHGTQVSVITMQVDDSGKIVAASGSDPKCQADDGLYSGFVLSKSIGVSNGKFSYKGKADTGLGDGSTTKVKLKGKFSSPKKSSGSYTLKGCKGKVKFKTSWTLGG